MLQFLETIQLELLRERAGMKRVSQIFILLFVSVFIFACNNVRVEDPITPDTKIEAEACRQVLNFVKKTSERDFDRRSNGEIGNLAFEGVLIVASFRDNFSDECLLKIDGFYIGSAPGAYLHDLIAKRDKEILPVIERAKNLRPECNAETHRCSSGRLEWLSERIKNQERPNLTIDNAGDPFQYIPKENVEQRLEKFNSEVKKILLLKEQAS